MFGPEDSFFNRFAALARFQLTLPLFGGGEEEAEFADIEAVAEFGVGPEGFDDGAGLGGAVVF